MIVRRHLPHGGKKINQPKLVVVHSMGEYILDPAPVPAADFLLKYKFSAHALVSPNGNIYRCRDDHERAWHARGFNAHSLGVEFLVEGNHNYSTFLEAIKEPYITTDQWEAGIELVRGWIEAHDITEVKRHSDVSPGRKLDPGDGFPWPDFLNRIGF